MRLASRRAAIATLTLVVGALALMPVFGHTEEEKPWGPYLRDKKGEAKPLPDKIAKIKDEDWLKIAYTDYHSIKPRVSVFLPPPAKDIDPSTINSDIGKLIWRFGQRDEKQPDGSDNVEVQLRQSLGATNRFRMVQNNTSVDHILDEQDYGAGGRVSGASASRLGRLTGSQYVAKAKLIEINDKKEAKSIGIGAGLLGGDVLSFGSVGVTGTVAYVCLNVSVMNTETGDIVTDLTVTGTSKAKGMGIGGGLLKGLGGGVLGGALAGMSSQTAASIGEAIQVAVNKVGYVMGLKFEDLPLSMNVIDVDPAQIAIEGGKDLGMQTGMLLDFERNAGPIVDAKGDTLEWKRVPNGSLKVTRVLPTVSYCEVVTGGKDAKKGDFASFDPAKNKK